MCPLAYTHGLVSQKNILQYWLLYFGPLPCNFIDTWHYDSSGPSTITKPFDIDDYSYRLIVPCESLQMCPNS